MLFYTQCFDSVNYLLFGVVDIGSFETEIEYLIIAPFYGTFDDPGQRSESGPGVFKFLELNWQNVRNIVVRTLEVFFIFLAKQLR